MAKTNINRAIVLLAEISPVKICMLGYRACRIIKKIFSHTLTRFSLLFTVLDHHVVTDVSYVLISVILSRQENGHHNGSIAFEEPK